LANNDSENIYIHLILGQALAKSRQFIEAKERYDIGGTVLDPNSPEYFKMQTQYYKSTIVLGEEM